MGRRKICVICNEPIIDEQSVPYKERFAHQKCFNIVIKTLQKDKNDQIKKIAAKKKNKVNLKKNTESKDALSEEEYKDKQQYYRYLRQITDTDELSVKTYAITEDYIKRYGFTFKDMYQTLVYLHEVIEKDLVGDIVGIIPYYYTESKKYYDSIDRIIEANKDKDVSDMYKQRVVLIQPKKRKIKQIDIESVGKRVD